MKQSRARTPRHVRSPFGMPSHSEIRWIFTYTLAGAIACGSSKTEDFFDTPPDVMRAGASGSSAGKTSGGTGGAGGSSGGSSGAGGRGGAAGSSVASTGGSLVGTGGSGASGTGGSQGGSAGMEPGTGGSGGTGGSVGGTDGSGGTGGSVGGTGGSVGGTGGSMGGLGGSVGGTGGEMPMAGSPGSGGLPAGGMGGTAGLGGDAGAPAMCDELLADAHAALEEAQSCNLAVSSLQCVDFVEDPCGCEVPVARGESSATKKYLAALEALEGCSVVCTAASCENPASARCTYDRPGSSTEGYCVGIDVTPF